MITNVSLSSVSKGAAAAKTPSFGMARLSEAGRDAADSFGYQRNDFLNPDMYSKQRFFQPSQLAKSIKKGAKFTDICELYGCTDNPKSNADFINNQILNRKSAAALNTVDKQEYISGLVKLYFSNFDNPALSLDSTQALLKMAKSGMSNEDYMKHSGILSAGTKE